MKAIEMVARRKLNKPETWELFYFRRIGDTNDCLVKGGTPKLRTRGKRKREKTWRDCKDVSECVVTEAEVKAELSRYESETDNCIS